MPDKKCRITHKHHIIPKHIGGSNDPSNIVELSIEEHAEAHRQLYELYGRWQDKLAWSALSGQISIAEAIKISQRCADKSWMKTKKGKEILSKRWEKRKANGHSIWNKGLKKEMSVGLQKLSLINKKYRELNKLSNIGDIVRGTQLSDSQKEKLSKAALALKTIKCPHCNKEVKPGPYGRWHGSNCKFRKYS